jgi:hypothetical protein
MKQNRARFVNFAFPTFRVFDKLDLKHSKQLNYHI